MAVLETLRSRVDHFVPFVGAVVGLLFVYQILRYVYNIFLHPLRKFPGPTSHAASTIPCVRSQLRGELAHHIMELHEQYGEVVRILPNELSFSSADSFKDIYGHRKAGQPGLQKFQQFYGHPFNKPGVAGDIVSVDDVTHARMRRVFANAFSDRSLKMQEPLFLTYVNRLIKNLRSTVQDQPRHMFNMAEMFNFTTFDIMGDLTFGEPLDLLNDDTYHGWVRAMFANFKYGAVVHSIRYFPFVETILLSLLSLTPLDKKRREHDAFSSSRVDRRLAKKDGEEVRPDIWGLVMAREGELAMSREEMYKNAQIFMIAGTETTATLLSGLTFYLLRNPEKMARLTEEIRGTFKSESELSIEKLQSLPYLHACIEEGLRMYPPVSNGLPRVVPPGGVVIAGSPVPAGSVVYTHGLSAYRNPKNFVDAYEFVPERWLGDGEGTKYAADKKHALNPFSLGPRGCLGRNMAYHEMRLILSKVLWNFDLELCEETGEFVDTKKIFVLWQKGPLWCRLKPVER